MVLEEEWQQLSSRNQAKPAHTEQLWLEIKKAYTARGRHYHNLQHLSALLSLADTYRSHISEADSVKLAIFYHDIVYSPLQKDNEKKSAAIAVERLQQLGLQAAQLEHIRQMILATQTHTPTADTDTNLLLDFDLSILGSEWETYLTYTQQIRKEYSIVPYFLYRKGRRKVLQHFLSMPAIYKTKLFQDQYELSAKGNIERELELLKA